VLLLVASTFAIAPHLSDLPPPIHVTVASKHRLLPPGTTLGVVAAAEPLEPRPGDFLDVTGEVLEAGRFPGRLEVDGERARPGRVLQDGDRIAVIDGRDRTEDLAQDVVPIPGGQVANPQAVLGTVPGEQVITKGAVSGKVVSTVFRPTGPVDAPLEVALTFDDGPSVTYTPQVLDILERLDVRATFFVVGTMVEAYPELVEQEAEAGMAIGNHTYSHPYLTPFGKLPRREIRREIRRCDRLLADLGVDAGFFRPPGGSWSPRVLDEAERFGMRTVLWAVDSRDWTRPAFRALRRSVLDAARPGAIILLHDGGGDRSATVKALPGIIRGLRRMGLEPMALT